MSKKQSLFLGILTIVLLMPVTEAKAQGYPVFDVGKLAGLITHLAGRFQPIPGVIQRVKQVTDIQKQVMATATKAMSGGLESLAKEQLGSLQGEAFAFAKSEITKAGESGAKAASEKVKSTFFVKKGKTEASVDEMIEATAARSEESTNTSKELAARALFAISNDSENIQKSMKTVQDANSQAESLHDKVNANTMAIMANSMQTLNQLTFLVTEMDARITQKLAQMPVTGYIKPIAPIFENSEYSDSYEKDEIDADLEQ